jgi:hypothetical protein
MTIWRALHEQLLYIYNLQGVHGVPSDLPARENFCRCSVQRSAEHFVVSSALLTDEARFGRDIINIHNQHQWAGMPKVCMRTFQYYNAAAGI